MTRVTRSMDGIKKLIDDKLDEFKASLIEKIKGEIDLYIEEKKGELTDVTGVNQGLLSSEHHESIRVIEKHVAELQLTHNVLKTQNEQLLKRVDELEQYTRRPNLRIYDIPVKVIECSKDVELIAKSLKLTYKYLRVASTGCLA